MRWLYKLKRKTRVIITVAVWILAVIGIGIVGSTLPENAESMQPWQAVVVVLCLAVATVVTVFAVIARNHEKKAAVDVLQADKEKPAAAQAEADIQRKLQDRRNVITVMPDGSVVVNFYAGGKKVYTPDEAKTLNIEPTIGAWTDEDDESNDKDIDIAIKNGVSLPRHTKAVGNVRRPTRVYQGKHRRRRIDCQTRTERKVSRGKRHYQRPHGQDARQR